MEHCTTYRYVRNDAKVEAIIHIVTEAGDADTAQVRAQDEFNWFLAQLCMSSSDGYEVPFDRTGCQPTDPELAAEQAEERAVHEAEIAAYKEIQPDWTYEAYKGFDPQGIAG